MAVVRRLYTFKGRVQGVGFRWTARSYAKQLGLSGWVRNEYDGSVAMEVQGSDFRVAALINHLTGDTYIRVDELTKKELPLVQGELGFEIRGW